MPEKERRAAIASTLIKVLAFTLDPTVRTILGQPRSTFDLGSLGSKIFVADLSGPGRALTALFANLLLAQLDRPGRVYLDGLAPFSPTALARPRE